MKYFSIKEFFPNCSYLESLLVINDVKMSDNLFRLGNNLDRIRAHVNKPVIITSGFRNSEHNKRVGGSSTSQHMEMEAVDISIPGYDLSTLESYLKLNFLLDFGQVIFYDKRNFVHLALRNDTNRSIKIIHI